VVFVLGLSRDPERVRAPDVALVTTARLPQGQVPERFIRGARDLAVEVLSPSDEQQKVHDYLDAGTRVVWVLTPEARSATVYRPDGSARFLREGDHLDGEAVPPGLVIPLAELFDWRPQGAPAAARRQ
jgi:Uma2 family endonuclease